MFGLLIGLTLAAAAPQPAQPAAPPAEIWQTRDDRARALLANLSFPTRPGVVRMSRAAEFSREGSGLDSGLRYESPDGAVFATVYLYRPGLPHAGVTSVATDWALHQQSPQVRELGARVVAAGGQDNAAIRMDYSGYRDGLASSAAFLKVDRWVVKIRVSGPEDRAVEVTATMAALLDDMRFEDGARPRPAAPIAITACGEGPARRAQALPDDGVRVMAQAMTATLDGGGEQAMDGDGSRADPLPSRVGGSWCRSALARVGDNAMLILRADGQGPGDLVDDRSMLLALTNDAGQMIELVRSREDQFLLLYHDIGRTSVLGTYDGPLTDEQVVAILSGADRDGGRVRATVDLLPSGDTNIEIRVRMPEDGR